MFKFKLFASASIPMPKGPSCTAKNTESECTTEIKFATAVVKHCSEVPETPFFFWGWSCLLEGFVVRRGVAGHTVVLQWATLGREGKRATAADHTKRFETDHIYSDKGSHCRAILWKTFWEVCGGLGRNLQKLPQNFSEVAFMWKSPDATYLGETS